MVHPHQSTIDLLRRMVSRLPPKFPRELGRYLSLRVEEVARDASISREALDRLLAETAREVWPYRKAFEDLWAREGQPQLAERFLAELTPDLRARIEAESGGQPLEVMRRQTFEAAFSPEEKLCIEEALLHVRHSLEEELRGRIETGATLGYDAAVLQWERERIAIEEAILQLRQLAQEKPRWALEIRDTITRFEEGMAGIGPELTPTEVRGAVVDFSARE